jgi:hypothetical protein
LVRPRRDAVKLAHSSLPDSARQLDPSIIGYGTLFRLVFVRGRAVRAFIAAVAA